MSDTIKRFISLCAQGGQRTRNFWKPGKVTEFCGTWKMSGKSQGISWNSEKSGNFNAKLGKVREFYLRKMNITEVLHKNKLMWMSIVIFKSCTRTPKSEKIFWKSQGILKSWNAGHPVITIEIKFMGSMWVYCMKI